MLIKNSNIEPGQVQPKEKSNGTFFSNHNYFFQSKLTIGPVDDPYEREADAVADQVMRMPARDDVFFSPKPIPITPFIQTKCAACEEEEKLQRKEDELEEENVVSRKNISDVGATDDENSIHVQRQETPPPTTPPPTTQISPDLDINWFEMSRPFLTRGAQHLLYDPLAYGSIKQQWLYNYNFFNTLGLGSLSGDASNFFTPFAIDSALKGDFPLPWEIWDRELNTSTIMIAPTLFNFDIHNLKKSFTMPSPFRGIFGLSENPYNVQRKCKQCEEEKDVLQRKGNKKKSLEETESVEQTLDSPGQSMDNGTKTFMENRFGHDFSGVRIHNDIQANQSSADINALAYTHHNHIVFGANQYQPNSDSGQRLIAHELTHVIQQKHANPFSPYVQRESIYEDVASVNANRAGGIVSGTVDRYEYEDRAAYNARIAQNRANAFHHRKVKVRFDSNRCVLEVPVSVQFVNQSAANPTACGDLGGPNVDPVTPVSSSTFTSAIPRIINTLNDNLNGWFNIQLGNPSAAGCRVPHVPIRVIVTQVAMNPDYTIIITGNSGRSYATGTTMVMCGAHISDESIITHEGGHIILGHGDEYRQKGRPGSRERPGQYSHMAQDAPKRLREFLERHFNFASEFMNTAFPGCKASLARGTREPAIEVNFNFQGTFKTPFGFGLMYSLGTEFGIPLTSMRRLSLMVGPNVNLLLADDIKALMFGVRAGLEYRSGAFNVGSTTLGFKAGLHGELGSMVNFGARGPESLFPNKVLSPYAEGGGHLGLTFGSRHFIGVEGAAGKISSPASGANVEFFRFGLRYGLSI